MFGLGLVSRQRGDRTAAAAYFRTAAEARPEISAAWIELAAELRAAGDYDVAREVIGKPLARNPTDLQALLGLGRVERSAGRRPNALAAFQRAQELHPQNPYPLIEAAAELHALGQPAGAKQLLLQALEHDAKNLQAMEQLGELARVAREYEEALGWFRQAIATRPSSIWAYLGAARTLSDLDQRDEASALIEEAERNCGPSPEMDSLRVDLLRLAGDWLVALGLARETAAAAPRHFGIWLQRFRMERLLSRPEEVEACLDAAPTTSVGDRVRLHHFRGQAAEEQWQIDEAIGHYEQALDLSPEDTWTLSDLIRARILALDIPTARAELAKLTRVTASSAILQGRSQNMSQTHFGQILDEFELDREALAELTKLRGVPAEQRLNSLEATIRRFPDYTPAAMMLMIALRQSGRLEPHSDPGSQMNPAIPRRFVQYWDSPNLPSEIADLMQTWRKAHPQYEFELFDDRKAQYFLQETCSAETLTGYRRSRELAQKADIFRLAFLFARGGYYVDADDRCLAPITTVIPSHPNLVLYQEDYGTLGNNFIGAAPQHPVLGLALDLAVSAINRGDNDILWFSTGPGLLTRALARTLCCSTLNLGGWLRNLAVLPRSHLHRAVAMHCQVAYKSTERHWSNTAFGQRRKAMLAGVQGAPTPPQR